MQDLPVVASSSVPKHVAQHASCAKAAPKAAQTRTHATVAVVAPVAPVTVARAVFVVVGAVVV